jgi:hypothetical protein
MSCRAAASALSLSLSLALSLLAAGPAAAQDAPPYLDYQGVLSDAAGQPVDVAVPITFRLYAVETGGAALWTETHPAVAVTGGVFSVRLGTVDEVAAPLTQAFDAWDGSPRWLGVEVDADGEMTPRHRLVSVPFALHAQRLGGRTAVELTADAVTAVATAPIDLAAGSTIGGAPLDDGDLAGSLQQVARPDAFCDGANDGAVWLDPDGTLRACVGTSQQLVFGAQSPGAQPWMTAGGDVYTTSGNVGIGTATPGAALDVAGEARAEGVTATDRLTPPQVPRPVTYCDGSNTGELWRDPSDGSLRACAAAGVVQTFRPGATERLALRRVIFVTAGTFNGALGGLSGADAACQAAADAGAWTSANAPGATWTALLSDPTAEARERVPGGAPLFNTNEEQVRLDTDFLWAAPLQAAPRYDEHGVAVAGGEVFTASTAVGAYAGSSCSGWTAAAGLVTTGNPTVTTASWQNASSLGACAGPARLYCVSSPLALPDPERIPDLSTARLLFVTSATTTGALGGLTGAHGLCRVAAANGAATAGIDAQWFALLATLDGVRARDHVQGLGAVVDVGGRPLARSVPELWEGALVNGVIADEDGAAATGNLSVWTGARPSGVPSGDDCAGWTDGASAQATVGTAGATGPAWLDASSGPCSAARRLYCISAPRL